MRATNRESGRPYLFASKMHLHCSAACWSQTNNRNFERWRDDQSRSEVAGPDFISRMKQRDDLPGFRVDARQIWTLPEIAGPTGKCQIGKYSCSSMLPGDDV